MPSHAFFRKQFMPLSEAKLGPMTQCIHYGTAVFEGIRGNWNSEQKQMYLFRLKEHYERLHRGCRVMKITLPYTVDELCRITVELAAKSGFREDMYLRPLAYKSTEAIGVRLHNLEDDFLAFTIPLGPYLDMDTAKCGVSSWRRPNSNVAPVQTKATGLYVVGALAKTEAHENGFDEAILLTQEGYVSEGSGENIFLVIDGRLVTPASYDNCLTGITRDTVIELAQKELGIETVERHVDRTELYTCEECFFTGTAAHVTAIGEIDHRKVGNGEVGQITKRLQGLYFDVIRGKNSKYLDWCTPVYEK